VEGHGSVVREREHVRRSFAALSARFGAFGQSAPERFAIDVNQPPTSPQRAQSMALRMPLPLTDERG